jgi:hypothetical protein
MIVKGPYSAFRDATAKATKMYVQVIGTQVSRVGVGFSTPDTSPETPGVLTGDLVYVFLDGPIEFDQMVSDGFHSDRLFPVNEIGYDVHLV